MKKHFFVFIVYLTAAVAGCSDGKDEKPGSLLTADSLHGDEIKQPGKYQIKSGIITYTTVMKTHSVDYQYKTIIYFDDYGAKECRDNYKGDTLSESLMSDGEKTYRIIHSLKKAFWSGTSKKGTEPKFGWSNVSEEDISSGKITRLPDERIAGKECLVYSLKSGKVTAKYAGWKDIIFLTEISSEGGFIATRAIRAQTGNVQTHKFKIPEGYTVQ